MSRAAADKPLEGRVEAKLAITTIDGTIDGGKMTFSKLIEGKGKDKTASFLADVTRVKDGRAPEFEGTVVTAAKFGQLIKDTGATKVLLYVHGYTNTPTIVFDAADEMNKIYAEKKGDKVLVIPVAWPAQDLIGKRMVIGGYTEQKGDAIGAAEALEALLPELAKVKQPLSILCHSMGNFVLKKMAPNYNEDVKFQFENIFMAAPDVRASVFDDKKNKEGDENADGKDILRLCKNKVHLLYHKGDTVLNLRRLMPVNGWRAALGRVGYDETKIIPGPIVKRECKDWNSTVGWAYWASGHSYHCCEDACQYYVDQM